MSHASVGNRNPSLGRRQFLAVGAGSVAAALSPAGAARGAEVVAAKVVTPPAGKRILLACKLSMLPEERDGKKLSAADRLRLAGQAGFDGVDFD